MARLSGLILTEDATFKTRLGAVLRAGPVPVTVVEERSPRDAGTCDIAVIDGRDDLGTTMAAIERMRVAAPNATIVNIALEPNPELILQSMRAGANEFFTWP